MHLNRKLCLLLRNPICLPKDLYRMWLCLFKSNCYFKRNRGYCSTKPCRYNHPNPHCKNDTQKVILSLNFIYSLMKELEHHFGTCKGGGQIWDPMLESPVCHLLVCRNFFSESHGCHLQGGSFTSRGTELQVSLSFPILPFPFNFHLYPKWIKEIKFWQSNWNLNI